MFEMFDQSPEKVRASHAYPLHLAAFLKMQDCGLRMRKVEQGV
jgi:hypothetical protein